MSKHRFFKYDIKTGKSTEYWKDCKCDKCYDSGLYHTSGTAQKLGVIVTCECKKSERKKELLKKKKAQKNN